MSSPSVSVVIPVRDAAAVPLLLRGLPEIDELVVVADAADEPLLAAVRAARPDAVLVHPIRRGRGAALAAGLAAARGDILVTLNSDGSADPAAIPRFVAALATADIALGSRYLPGASDLTAGRFHRWANLLLARLIGALLGVKRSDPGFGYAALRRTAAPGLTLPDPAGREPAWGDGPEIEALLTLRPATAGLRLAEVATTAYPRLRRAREDRIRLTHWLKALRHERSSLSSNRHHPGTGPAHLRNARIDSAVIPLRNPRNSARAARLPDTPDKSDIGWTAASQGDPTGSAAARNARAAEPGSPRSAETGNARNTKAGNARNAEPGSARNAEPGSARAAEPGSPRGAEPGSARAAEVGEGLRAIPAIPVWPGANHQKAAETPWSPARRDPMSDLWTTATRPTASSWTAGYTSVNAPAAADRQPRPTSPAAPGPDVTPGNRTRREIGTKRRRLDTGQRPDLRVINGEGTGSRTRPPRLRAIPGEG